MMQFPGSNGGAGSTPRRGGNNNDIIIGRENFDRVLVKENGRTRQIEQLPIASGTSDIVAIYQENTPESMRKASAGEILNEFATDTVTEGLKLFNPDYQQDLFNFAASQRIPVGMLYHLFALHDHKCSGLKN